METISKCKKCETEVITREIVLVFAEEKKMEIALCPVCKNEVHKGETDGWFFVQTTERSKLSQEKLCVYPNA